MIHVPESFPIPFTERNKQLFCATDMDRLLNGFSVKRQTWFRKNPLVEAYQTAFEELDTENVALKLFSLWPDAGWVESDERPKLLGSAVLEAAKIYIQGMASQIPVRMLDPQPGEEILDLTAAPGSKTLQIVATAPTARVAAVEIVRKRKFKLSENLKRNGAHEVRVFHQDGTKVWKYRPEYFDRILLDAPCSSEGRFQFSDEDTFRFWTPGKSREMVRKQRRLLYSAVHSLKPGGTLVYSTCAISPTENEGAVQHVLESFDGAMEVVPIEFDVPERIPTIGSWGNVVADGSVSGACRLMPSERMEGFFICRFRKTRSTSP